MICYKTSKGILNTLQLVLSASATINYLVQETELDILGLTRTLMKLDDTEGWLLDLTPAGSTLVHKTREFKNWQECIILLRDNIAL